MISGSMHFWGALKITKDADSIGLALFRTIGGNSIYIAEMDAEFRIVEFLHFSRSDRYVIESKIPISARNSIFAIGHPAPIPYWIRGICYVISGDAEERDVFRDHGADASTNGVLQDLRRYLANARNGVYREEQQRWAVDEITADFHDLFNQTPVHSPYWIRRLGEAVRYARKLTTPPHPIDDELRRIALDWIAKFATKTDYDRMMAVVGHLLEGAIAPERAQSMVFAFLVNKISSGEFPLIEKAISKDARFDALFPEGIYRYWWINNWPNLPFKYKKPFHLLEPLRIEIERGEKKRDFRRAERLSYLLFKNRNAPEEVDDLVRPLIEKYYNKLMVKNHAAKRYFDDPRTRATWESKASGILYLYHVLMSLDGILDGNHRMSRAIVNGRFGMSQYNIIELEMMAGIYD